VVNERPDGALLAGVCSSIASTLSWNVWVLRALFIGFLAIKTILALVVYAILALVIHLIRIDSPGEKRKTEGLTAPELSGRNQRIADLEQQFRELDQRAASGGENLKPPAR
jgi:phage shock protein PspC (stress-responsive transcriptional regulator)